MYRMIKQRKKLLRPVFALALAVCLAAWLMPVRITADAASEFKYASPFSRTGYSAYSHKSKYSGNLIVNGVDISVWQSAKCRFDDAKADGVDFCILRVSGTYYGKSALSIYNDDNFETQFKNAGANGVMRGVYVFSQAKNANEGIKEANYAVRRLKALGIGPEDLSLPVYMDYEFGDSSGGRLRRLNKTNATNAAVGFCNAIKTAGYQPGIYASTSFFTSYIDTSKLASDVDIWCAQYYNRNTSLTNYSKWQYSSKARINGMLSRYGLSGNIDADFWYINKKKAKSGVVAKITGRTVLSVADAKSPKFKLYNKSGALLKQGRDYTVGGIRNNRTGSAYVYIKGIGSYGGYALIPIKVAKTSSGSASKTISCANYLTKANKERSQYIVAETVKYTVGSTYTVQDYLNIRKGAGTGYGKVRRSSLSSSMKKKTVSGNVYAVLKKGAKIKCLKISGNWMKISGGWVCCREGTDIYVK